MGNDIDTIRSELDEARQSLHQTVVEVNQKVALQIQPQHLVEKHLPFAAFLAGTLGFAVGNRGARSRPGGGLAEVATFVLGAVVGAALKEASTHGRNHDKTAKQ
jgi:hypothetical protein